MKTLAIALITAMLSAAGCNKGSVSPTTPTDSTASSLRVSAPFADQTTQFAFDVAGRVNQQGEPVKTCFCRP
ncbi:hypothetical protein [Spirosoma rhododendri]|uniref:hypothetical protein n=1 Tax=Spirosoma rhododendri TaxID=2728024 RepID=UPI0020C36077|nr:hypothetical protein [Spirosoma rhododendri]